MNLCSTRAGGRIWMDPSIRSTYFSRGTLAGLWRQYHGYGFSGLRSLVQAPAPVRSPAGTPVRCLRGGGGRVAGPPALRRSPWPAAAVLVPYATGAAASSASAAGRTDTAPATVAAA